MVFVERPCSGSKMSWEGTYPSLCWHVGMFLVFSSVVCRCGSSLEHHVPGPVFSSCGCCCALALAGFQHQFVEGPSDFLESPVALPVVLLRALPVALLVH